MKLSLYVTQTTCVAILVHKMFFTRLHNIQSDVVEGYFFLLPILKDTKKFFNQILTASSEYHSTQNHLRV